MTLYHGYCEKGQPCWVGNPFYEIRIDFGAQVNIKAVQIRSRTRIVAGSRTNTTIEPRWFTDGTLGIYDTTYNQLPDEIKAKNLYEDVTCRYIGALCWSAPGGPTWEAELDYFEVFASDTTDLPPEVWTPGQQFCIGPDLYRINDLGTGVELVEADSYMCVGEEGCPPFFEDPAGWVLCHLILAMEALMGWATGTFLWLQQQIHSFIVTYGSGIADLFADPVNQITNWFGEALLTISDFLTEFNNAIISWWAGTTATVQGWISDAVSGFEDWMDEAYDNIHDFVQAAFEFFHSGWESIITGIQSWIDESYTNIAAWWEDAKTTIGDAWSSAISALQGWIDDAYTSINDWWSSTQETLLTTIVGLGLGLSDWIDETFSNIGEWWEDRLIDINDMFADWGSAIHDVIMEKIPGIVEEMIKLPDWLTAPFLAIGQFATKMFELLTGNYPKEEEIKESETTIQEHMDEVKDLIGGI